MSANFNAFVKSFDLFSKPFVFFVGDKNNKNKTTFIGGLLSLSVLSISIIYFYYLINMYLDHKVEPKITSRMSIESSLTELEITENFFIFEMLINGEPLNQYQERVGKVFLTYSVNYEISYSNGTYTSDLIPFVVCSDQQFKGFLCIEDKDIKNKNIFLEPILLNFTDFSLEVNYCDPLVISNCASPEEIQSTIFTPTNFFQVFTKIRQYNPSSRAYENGYKAEYFYFDPYNIVFTRISLVKATTTVKEGLLIQTSNSSDDIYDFKRIDSTFSTTDIEKRMGISGIAYILFEINQVRNIIMIQHAMITEILAQFMSIFNALLIVGIIAQMFAQTHIVEDMNNILLKEYFKKSAIALVSSKQEGKQRMQYEQQPIDRQTSFNNENAEILSHEIALLQKKIKTTNFTSGEKKYFNFSFVHEVRLFFAKLLGNSKKINRANNYQDSNKEIQRDSVIYQQLLNQSIRGINIYEVYKDLIKLKMAIKIMLTKEQYAAIQFCGSEILSSENNRQDLEEEKPNELVAPKGHLSLLLTNNAPMKQAEDNNFKTRPGIAGMSTFDLLKSEKEIIKNGNSNVLNEAPYAKENCQMSGKHQGQTTQLFFKEEKPKMSYHGNEDEQSGKTEMPIQIVKFQNEKLEIEKESPNEIGVSQKKICSLQNVVKLQNSENYIVKKEGDDNNYNELKLIELTDGDGDDDDDDDYEDEDEGNAEDGGDGHGNDENHRQQRESTTIRKELQKNTKNNQKIIKNEKPVRSRRKIETPKGFNLNFKVSHLSEMDLIDDDPMLQEDLLKSFLQRIGQGSHRESINHIDKQIFQSLIRNTENNYVQNQEKDKNETEKLGEQQEYPPEVCFFSTGMIEEKKYSQKYIQEQSYNNIISPRHQLEDQNVTTNPQLIGKRETD